MRTARQVRDGRRVRPARPVRRARPGAAGFQILAGGTSNDIDSTSTNRFASVGIGPTALEAGMVAVPLPAGTLRNLRVAASVALAARSSS